MPHPFAVTADVGVRAGRRALLGAMGPPIAKRTVDCRECANLTSQGAGRPWSVLDARGELRFAGNDGCASGVLIRPGLIIVMGFGLRRNDWRAAGILVYTGAVTAIADLRLWRNRDATSGNPIPFCRSQINRILARQIGRPRKSHSRSPDCRNGKNHGLGRPGQQSATHADSLRLSEGLRLAPHWFSALPLRCATKEGRLLVRGYG